MLYTRACNIHGFVRDKISEVQEWSFLCLVLFNTGKIEKYMKNSKSTCCGYKFLSDLKTAYLKAISERIKDIERSS